tara:strand:- start:3061 stop:4341 length:1281 start_codon:yes stop_codon:yes gene_type:complete
MKKQEQTGKHSKSKSEAAAVWVNRTELSPWSENPRDNEHAVEDVANSIRRFGFASPIIARKNGEIIAGHTRFLAAEKLGLDRVPVRYMDLDPADAKLLALADNKVGEIADWNDDLLRKVLVELEAEDVDVSGIGWTADELATIMADEPFDLDEDEFDVPGLEAGEQPVSQPGEIFELGPHRLICGDSTDPDVWEALMQGEKLKCVWTDPPYGVSVNAVKDIEEAKRLNRRTDGLMVSNDSMSPEETADLWHATFTELVKHSEPGAAWYASAPAGPIFWRLGQVLEDFNWRRTLVWVKDRFVMGRGDYHYRHEPIFHGWFDGAARLNPVPRTVDTVQECKRPGSSKEHPTMKPVELIAPMIENSSVPGWLVGEPFAGSGSTLMACAKTHRVARCIELDPHYCDVIRRRWTRWAKANGQDPGSGALDG